MLSILCSLALPALAAPQEFSTPIRLTTGGPAYGGFELAQDERSVVYRGREGVGPNALFLVPIDGRVSTRRLTPDPVAGGNARASWVATETHLFYLADEEVDGRFEVFSVPLDGPASSTKWNGSLTLDGDVRAPLLVSPDRTRLVYRADQDTDETIELYSVELRPGALPIKLNVPLPTGGNVTGAAITPDGAQVVYRADQCDDDVFELLIVPIDGGSVASLNPALVANGDVQSFTIAPQANRVLYLADQNLDEVIELFSAPLPGNPGKYRRVNPALPLGGSVLSYLLAPNGQRVAYLELRGGKTGLWTAGVAGRGWGQAEDEVVGDLGEYGFTADSSRVLWDRGQGFGASLMSNGNAPDVLESDSALLLGLSIATRIPFASSPSGRTVAMFGEDLSLEPKSVPSDGSAAPTVLSHREQAQAIATMPDDLHAAYIGDSGSGSQLFRVPLDGSEEREVLTPDIGTSGPVASFTISSDGRSIVYRAEQGINGTLYSVCVLELDGIDPPAAAYMGGELVTLTGHGFTPNTTVLFDGVPATQVTRQDGETLTARIPAAAWPTAQGKRRLVSRMVDVELQDGSARVRLERAFRYTWR